MPSHPPTLLFDCPHYSPHTPLISSDHRSRTSRTAHSYAQNTHQKTPWSVSACETGMPWARFFVKGGGKMDDVTVIVGFVVSDSETPQQ